jgi:hypothetical protein
LFKNSKVIKWITYYYARDSLQKTRQIFHDIFIPTDDFIKGLNVTLILIVKNTAKKKEKK